jgi:autotransporter-associated beta strand protein
LGSVCFSVRINGGGTLNKMTRFGMTGWTLALVAEVIWLLGGVEARAASASWIQTSGGPYEWAADVNWGGTAYPKAASEVATIKADLTAAATINLTSVITVGGIAIGDPTSGANNEWPYTIAGNGGSLVLNNGASAATITHSGASFAGLHANFNTAIQLQSDLALVGYNNSVASDLILSGAISEDATPRNVTVQTAAGGSNPSVHLLGTNTFTGKTTVQRGLLKFNSIANAGTASSLGMPTGANAIIDVNTVAGCYLTYTGPGHTTDRVINFAGTGALTVNASGTGRLVLTAPSPFTYSVGADRVLALYGLIGTQGEIRGSIADCGGKTTVYVGSGATWYLLGTNTFTGPILVPAGNASGTVVINSIANAGTACSLGAPTGADATISLGNTGAGGILKYIGLGHSTDRAINAPGTIVNGSPFLDASGIGKFTLSGTVSNSGAASKTLALTGTGEGELSGVIYDYDATCLTSLSKTGTGTWALKGDNKFTGTVTLNGAGGRLVIGHANALGLGAGAIALTAGTLDPGDAPRTIANPLTLTAHTIAGTNNLTLNGTLTALTGAGRTLTSSLDAGKTLTLTNVVVDHTAAISFTLQGTGDTTINGVISESGAAGAKALSLRNRGTTKINKANTHTGATSLSGGGTVILNYDTSDGGVDGDHLPNAVLNLANAMYGGCDLILKGGTHTEAVASTTMGAAGHFNVIRQGVGATSKLQLGAITFGNDASINFAEDDLATCDNPNYNGILKKGNVSDAAIATVGGVNWAYNSTGGAGGLIKALPSGSYTDLSVSSANANYIVTGSYTLPAARNDGNSLKIVSDGVDQVLDVSTYGLSGASLGGILYAGGGSGNNKYTIRGTGAVFGNANTRTISVASGAELTIDAPIGSSAVCQINKFGPGRAIFATNNTTTGAIRVNEGALRLKHATASGTTAGGIFVAASVYGSALELDKDKDGNAISIGAEALTIQGNGITNSGALRNIAGDNSYAGAITLQHQGARINSDADTLTLSGGIVTVAGNDLTVGGAGNITVTNGVISGAGGVIKDGAGTATLAAANTYSGATTVNGGTLKVTGSIAAGSAVTVNDGGTLAGSGACYGSVRVHSNGTIRALGGNLTVSNLVLGAGSKVSFDPVGDNKIVVATPGALSDTLGLTILPGATVSLVGTVGSGVYTNIQYTGVLRGSVTNLSVANPASGSTYAFSAAGGNVMIEVSGGAKKGTILFVR